MEKIFSTIIPVLGSVRTTLMARKNVVATGIGYKVTAGKKTDQLSIICSVEQKEPSSKLSSSDLLPQSIGDIPTDVVATGRIRAFQSPTDRLRPAPGGVSIGHFETTAGTLGCLVQKDGQTYILSNNHVLANSNDAAIGDPILQPGPYDGGQNPADQIAELREFVPIHFTDSQSQCPIANGIADLCNGLAFLSGSSSRLQAISIQGNENLVDAAIALPLKPNDIKNEILHAGTITGSAEGELGMAIKKSGRTTVFTTGEIQQVDVTVSVQYGGGKVAQFSDQLLAGAMSQGGDSGSAVLNEENRLIGLLFAGSDQTTVINRIQNVYTALGVSL